MSLITLMAFVAYGCNTETAERSQQTTPPGSQMAAEDDPNRVVTQKPIAGEADHTFSLSVPFESIALSQGEEQSAEIGINRGTDFREDVAIEVSGLPDGVTVEPVDPVVTSGSTGITLTFHAADDAALGDFTVKIIGHTESSGEDFSTELTLTVKQ